MFVSFFVFFLVFALFLKVVLWTHHHFFWQIWDHISKTVFPKDFFLSCNLHSKMSRNMCIWSHKVCNGPILPPWSPNFEIIFFKIYLRTIQAIFSQIWGWPQNQHSFFSTQFVLFSIPSSRISRKMCKWGHKLQKSVGPPFTWWNEAWSIKCVWNSPRA